MAGEFHAHLGGNVVHVPKHAADGERAKGGDEDAMSLAPVRFIIVGLDEEVRGCILEDSG